MLLQALDHHAASGAAGQAHDFILVGAVVSDSDTGINVERFGSFQPLARRSEHEYLLCPLQAGEYRVDNAYRPGAEHGDGPLVSPCKELNFLAQRGPALNSHT